MLNIRTSVIAHVVLSSVLAVLAFQARPVLAATPPTAEVCAQRANDTPAKLLECIQAQSLWPYLTQFQTIADDNPGPDGHGYRDTGTPGYRASVAYVAGLMRRAGYTITIQPYNYRSSKVTGVPEFSTSSHTYTPSQDWYVARLSGSGTLTAPIRPAAGSGTGCFAEDFAGFAHGNIALLPRANCVYDVQVENASRAGAGGIILYNRPETSNAGVFQARLTRPATIPVVSTSYKIGSELLRGHDSGQVTTAHLDVRTEQVSGVDYNLIADSPFGDTQHVVVVEGHLDSIFGAGMLDNASGSTTILGIALNMAKTPTLNQLRYIWFGGEELGLLGSDYYTQNLSSTDRAVIAFDVDADVTATPNYDYLYADPRFAYNVRSFPPNVVRDSEVGNQFYKDYFLSVGVPLRASPFGNSGTDSNSFSLIGIPNTGILTEQDCCKEQSEVAVFGGFTGNYEGNIPSFDGGCVDYPNRWCDNLSNNDPTVFEVASKATAYVTLQLANYAFAPRKSQ